MSASLIALLITHGGLVPSEIQALGIRLTEIEVGNLRLILAVVVTYLLLAFVLYAANDWYASGFAAHELGPGRMEAMRTRFEVLARRTEETKGATEFDRSSSLLQLDKFRDEMEQMRDDLDALKRAGVAVSYQDAPRVLTHHLRHIFEFALPVAVSLYATTQLLSYQEVVRFGSIVAFGLIAVSGLVIANFFVWVYRTNRGISRGAGPD